MKKSNQIFGSVAKLHKHIDDYANQATDSKAELLQVNNLPDVVSNNNRFTNNDNQQDEIAMSNDISSEFLLQKEKVSAVSNNTDKANLTLLYFN